VNSDSEFARGIIGERALVAAFVERDDAHRAAKTLHEEGFHKTWIGLTRADETVKSEDDSIGAKIGRFLSGEADGATLIETLVRHGVSEAEARRVEGQIDPNDVLLTVDGNNHPELAAQILEDAGGDILAGESFVFTTVEWGAADDRLGSELLGYQDPNEFARGQRVDDKGLTRLRNERLLNDTVPNLREDIFIARFDDELDDETPKSGTSRAGASIGTRLRGDLDP
jgi:hypothetical protein